MELFLLHSETLEHAEHVVRSFKIIILELVPVLLTFGHKFFVPLSGIDLGHIQASFGVEIFHDDNLVEVVAAPIDLSNIRQYLINPVNFCKVLLPYLRSGLSFLVFSLMSMFENFSELNLMLPSRNVFLTMWSW